VPSLGAQQAVAAPLAIQYASTTNAGFSSHWGIVSSAILTGTNPTTHNGRSTGSVAIALFPDAATSARVGGPAVTLPAAVLTTSSSALGKPDTYHTTFSFALRLRDSASGASAVLTFTGTINGTLGLHFSALTATLQGPLTRQVTLGNHVYTVRFPAGTFHLPAPGTTPLRLNATVQVNPRTR
jgi:hypothetical protein